MAQKVAELIGNTTELQTWLCQSKRYTDKKISKSDIAESLNSAREHRIDYFLLAISATLTADMKDWLNSIKRDYSFKIVLWEDIDLRREVKKYSRIIAERFPNLLKQNDVVHFYEMKMDGKTYFCDEIDEVGFYILNDYGHEVNIKWIQEFIDFIKMNDISFKE